ncbi:t1pks [Curvularia kusanoi]|uniref:T1pks n=1 Tax=Curvularia kusanoi TaxID=90978 RepID=A0A9P4TAW5_CURKU|nr:t1pks [Curvularia kusanoi]
MDKDYSPQPIAIIGTACRLPGGASSPSKLWQLLKNPRDLLRDVPRDRFHWESIKRSDGLHGSVKTQKGYFLDENIRQFDPEFFKMSPAEAENIDPQHRLLLENVYEAIESAGLRLEDLHGTDVGVFTGLMADEYYQKANRDVDASCGQILTTGTARSMAANRISYTFDFRGPSMSIDTACSSSMMAVHLAVSSLRRGESSIAFACGAHLILTPNSFKCAERMGMISADGRSKMFDESADGYGRGEGTAVVCLKLLDAAVRDGDPIECIIRETGTNQDGRTKGITMPSAEAQAKLIQQTYARAGLDLTCPGSRPLFFEAHGTGTLVGDPLEAQAIKSAFFPPGRDYEDDEVMYVGSIKTVIGHTEGTAGLAGLLRAALAVQHAIVPPNLLFQRMNPRVQPHTKHLRLPTAAMQWPGSDENAPRRASINSFGFGGSNVHVIIESYSPQSQRKPTGLSSAQPADLTLFTPLVFSGISERALTATLRSQLEYVRRNRSDIHLHDLAWTLQARRSQSDYRCSIAADNVDEFEAALEKATRADGSQQFVRSNKSEPGRDSPPGPRVLGIFTGQGAQWAAMGKELLESSPWARLVIARLDHTLASLPAADRPDWNIYEQLVLRSKESRVHEAEFAQTLTTAIQILLVDLVALSGLRFSTVVGHSSGEIAAAYASGFLQAKDAIRIAYYRGLHSRESAGRHGEAGGMLAAALSADEAEKFCNQSHYAGCLNVAAFNSPSLITISGDHQKVAQAVTELEAAGVFARQLKVTKAYHSHHMRPCAGPYLQSLQHLHMVSPQPRKHSPTWYSSVLSGAPIESSEQIGPEYWIQNLLSPVQFSSAVHNAISRNEVPDLVLEIGPHPTLEKAVRQIFDAAAKDTVNYSAFLRRGSGATKSIAGAFGSIWARFGRAAVDFAHVEAELSSSFRSPRQIKDLPSYPWQHNTEYWWENRLIRKGYQSETPPIELLGTKWEMGASHESKWRAFLNPRETPWLLEHRLNGVAVLPGAAYVVMALTAAKQTFNDQLINMIEVQNLRFELPIAIPDEKSSIEIILTMARINKSDHDAQAEFYIDFCSHPRSDDLITAARGNIFARFGFDTDRSSPGVSSCPLPLTTVNCENFYKSLSERGYGYSGHFEAIKSLHRRIDYATGMLAVPYSELVIHPAAVDGLFQSSFAAEGHPADSAMPNFRVPASIKSIKIFPTRCEETFKISEESLKVSGGHGEYSSTPVQFRIHRTAPFEYAGSINGEVERGVLCQMEGLVTVPFRLSTEKDDLTMFREVKWIPERPYHLLQMHSAPATDGRNADLALAQERVAFYYLRQLLETSLPQDGQKSSGAIRHLLEFARLTVNESLLGKHDVVLRSWFKDNKETIDAIIDQYVESVDLQCVRLMGNAYASIVDGEETAVHALFQDDHLQRFYRDALDLPETNQSLADFVAALTSHSPNMTILEIGAGTGASSELVLSTAHCAKYMFTDISSAFFESAKQKLKRYSDIVSYQTFDMERSPLEQGLTTGSIDIVVASNVLHASSDVLAVLRNVRSLLKPGGHLVCVELAGCLLSHTVIMGGLEGWWLGHGKDRSWTPSLSERQWNDYLKATSFSGIECITPVADLIVHPYRVFCSQATDERVQQLRHPLDCWKEDKKESLLILGEHPADNPGLIPGIVSLLSRHFAYVSHVEKLSDVKDCDLTAQSVISLVELTTPLFENITSQDWLALQSILGRTSNVLWLTVRATSPSTLSECYSNMTVGLMRTIRNELPHLSISVHDVEGAGHITAEYVAETVLRQDIVSRWESTDTSNDNLVQHTEVAVRNGIRYIPSIRLCSQANRRYNSRHRRIHEHLPLSGQQVEMVYERSAAKYTLRNIPPVCSLTPTKPTVSIDVRFSTLLAIDITHLGSCHLNVGTNEDGARVFALSKACCSRLVVPQELVFALSPTDNTDEEKLRLVTARIIAERVVDLSCPSGTTIAIANDPLWRSAIRTQAVKRAKKIFFATSQALATHEEAVWLDLNTMDMYLQGKIPIDVSFVANVSNDPQDKLLFDRLCTILRRDEATIQTFDAFFNTNSTTRSPRHGFGGLRIRIASYLKVAGLRCADAPAASAVVRPQDVARYTTYEASTMVDWDNNHTVAVTAAPATKAVQFNPEKTYLIIGSSDIARSLCEWMVASGAKHIVLASRRPNDLHDWAMWLTSKRARIHTICMDVTDRDSVCSGLASIYNDERMKLPPIAGVMHLALVLHDAAFSNMAYDDLKAVTDVKASGSRILHDALSHESLDFFILTSSISYVAGNRGQANYAAGNAFMVGLAQYRRSLGLPASVVHLGHVSGKGYIHRNSHHKVLATSISELHKYGLYPISERDIHDIFAEAILASPANSETGPEVFTGIRDMERTMLTQCTWLKAPMFAHVLKAKSDESKPMREQEQSTRMDLSKQLAASSELSAAEIRSIITDAFSRKVGALLQIDDIDENKNLLDLGVDSLAATEIGSWARKELRVQIPNQLIFGGASLGEIVDAAITRLDRGWVELQASQ